MFDDEESARKLFPALVELAREDLERLSREDLEKRIAHLEAEIARSKKALEAKGQWKSAAASLFKS